jgi:hypothetical protein
MAARPTYYQGEFIRVGSTARDSRSYVWDNQRGKYKRAYHRYETKVQNPDGSYYYVPKAPRGQRGQSFQYNYRGGQRGQRGQRYRPRRH